ncbi:MAG: subclass B3 metallo-beta-lactamase [Sphingomonas sp.]|jgi:metallo-beta-lactamase class B|uniref:subclass B3 metallo-beta-lactamase n=1 Tax=Sphingomonas sp. TaxID=28214 RepID=UPI0035645DAD
MKWMVFGGVALASVAAMASAQADDPLTRPIEPDYAARWLTPQEPVRVHGNFYLVGFGGLNVGLIRTSAGLILIDGAVPQAVAGIEDHLRQLGFKVTDVKFILSTEPHYDHAGGIAALARDSGAKVVASRAGAQVLGLGQSLADDPQFGQLAPYPAVAGVLTLEDGEKLRLGDTVITARATPGHTAGSMSWTWRNCAGSTCRNMVFGASLNPVSTESWGFSDPKHAATVAAFRKTFKAFATLPCDILVTSHPDASGGDVKLAKFRASQTPNPFVDPGACRAYAAKYEGLLDARIARERSGTAKP